jgi:hypothetical protein
VTAPSATSTHDRWLRPAVVLPVLLALLVLVILLVPEEEAQGRFGDNRLSAHLAGPLGARAIADVATRLGWRVVLRDETPTPTEDPGTTVHAVLAPPQPLTAAQAHRYLEAVRDGDALLLVLSDKSLLGDSLGVRAGSPGGILRAAAGDTIGCARFQRPLAPPLWIDGRAHLYELRWIRGAPASAVDFAPIGATPVGAGGGARSAGIGFALGAGRVVVISDPDLLRNDVIGRCAWGADVIAVRMLEWLRASGASPRVTLAFDEYHQGYGPRSGSTSVTGRFLVGHPVGRTILQLGIAALVLLLAVGPRPIAPSARPRAERRDPLEQADALAHAYQQVTAIRTASQRLLRAVRARAEGDVSARRAGGDDAFLESVASHHPARAGDVALVQRAIRHPEPTDALPLIGAALNRIEADIHSTTLLRA